MIPFGPKQTKNLKISSGYIETSGRPHAARGACVKGQFSDCSKKAYYLPYLTIII
jgi:hypothetical protein